MNMAAAIEMFDFLYLCMIKIILGSREDRVMLARRNNAGKKRSWKT